MKPFENDSDVLTYIRDKGWIERDTKTCVTPLSGGVSCSVWKIETDRHRWVLKQALAQLKVKIQWSSDVQRIEREQLAMRTMLPFTPAGSIPQILFTDPERHLYVMTCASDDAVTWKQQLMNKQFDTDVAYKVGALLKQFKEGSRNLSDDERTPFADLTYFHELRIAPFYEYLIGQYPSLETRIRSLINSLTRQGTGLVHGDFSPKNILVDARNELVILDFEVAHWGNVSFDVAFCMTHLLLKGWATRQYDKILSLITAFGNGYGQSAGREVISHAGLLLLARMDGKSPIEYITDKNTKQQIRETALRWINGQHEDAWEQDILNVWRGR